MAGGIWSKKIFNSRIKSANIGFKEILFGYLLGPIGGLVINQIFACYLNMYWTDVIGIENKAFLTLFPLVSTIFIVIGNFVVGRLLDKNKTAQGKGRPFLLISSLFIFVTSLLIFLVPSDNELLRLIWVAVTYNLFYSVAFPLYSASNSIMLPLSTRNSKQRGLLSTVTNLAGTGSAAFATMVMPLPFILPLLGVSRDAWLFFMVIVASIALLCIVLQYYFTRERISEEEGLETPKKKISTKAQIKSLITNKQWLLLIIFYFIFQLVGQMQNFSMVYYCNYILGTYNDGFTQTILGLVTGLPMLIAMFFVWPLSNKFGKKNLVIVGLIIAIIGTIIAFIWPDNWTAVIVGLCLKCLGASPAIYTIFALQADALDNAEAKSGFRSDGLNASIVGAIGSILTAICTGVFNAMLASTGYVAPNASTDGITNEVSVVLEDGTNVFVQNAATKSTIVWAYFGFMIVGYIICALVIIFVDVEKHSKETRETILARQQAEAEELGIPWISPEEKLKMQEEENERIAEESRIKELKEKCLKKNLDFEKEEAKYQKKKKRKFKLF